MSRRATLESRWEFLRCQDFPINSPAFVALSSWCEIINHEFSFKLNSMKTPDRLSQRKNRSQEVILKLFFIVDALITECLQLTLDSNFWQVLQVKRETLNKGKHQEAIIITKIKKNSSSDTRQINTTFRLFNRACKKEKINLSLRCD